MEREAASTEESHTVRDRALTTLVVGVSAALLGWMGRALLTGGVPFTGDLLHFHYPLREFYATALARHQRFDWMPSLFAGLYVVGEGQLGGYHPLHWLLYRFVPLQPAFAIETVAAYPFAFAGTWLWLRGVCPTPAAAFGAMLFTFCGFNLSHGVHPNMVGIVAHLPWLLWAIQRAFLVERWRGLARWCAAIGLLTGSQLLLGHPQAVWFSGLAELAYLAFLTATSPRLRRLPGVCTVVGGGVLGLAVGAIQVLATLHAVARSVRSTYDASFATDFSLPPLHLVQLVQPYGLWGRVLRWNEAPGAGDEFAAYGGAVALVLVAWWMALVLVRGAPTRAHRPTQFGLWTVLFGLLGLWLATGGHGGLYDIQTWLPIVRQFRAPVRYVLFAQLALACVAALALATLMRAVPDDARARRRALWAPWAVVAVSAACTAILLVFQGTGAEPWDARAAATWLGPLLFAMAAGLVSLAVRSFRWAVPALVLLAAGDHALYGLGGVIGWQDVVPRAAIVPLLGPSNGRPPVDGGRILRGGFPNLYTLGGYQLLDGYVAIAPLKQLRYDSLPALQAANLAYAHVDAYPAGRTAGVPLLGGEWYPVPDVSPRVRLVTEAIVSRHPEVDIEHVDHTRAALVMDAVPLGGGPAGTVNLVRDEPGDIGVRTTATSTQLLVVSESYDDGWTATIDGEPAVVKRVNGDFMGTVVPPGTHDVSLQFSPAHLAWGKRISLGGLLVTVLLAGASRPARRS